MKTLLFLNSFLALILQGGTILKQDIMKQVIFYSGKRIVEC